MMNTVIFNKTGYADDALRPAVHALLDATAPNLISPGLRVLIKPNLLLPARVDDAALTHPHVVKAVVEYVLEKGGRVTIADSPAMGPFDRILRRGGYADALSGMDATFSELNVSVPADIGQPFGRIDMAKEILEADLIINLPKLKTHSQMLLTLGVKNMFGAIVGFKKSEWHLRSGVDRDRFAELLVRIYEKAGPALTLLDGVLALEGDGPGKSGTPRHVGVIAAARSAHALDAAVCRMLKIQPEAVPTHNAARRMGLWAGEPNIRGDFFQVDGFKTPDQGPLTFGPKRLQKLMRKHLIQRPAVNPDNCKVCGECRDFCPAKAITLEENAVRFDYDRCIRCYCCVEICPFGALRAENTLAGRMLRLLPIF